MHSPLLILLFTFFSFWPHQPFVEPFQTLVSRLAKIPANFVIVPKNAFQYVQTSPTTFSNSMAVPGKKIGEVKLTPIRIHEPNLAAPKIKPNQTLPKNTVVKESTLPIKSAINWLNKLGTVREYVKKNAMFRLDKVPKNGVYIPKVVHQMENGKRKTMAKMLTYTGRTLYNGLWKASSAIQKIPNPYRRILFLIALVSFLVLLFYLFFLINRETSKLASRSISHNPFFGIRTYSTPSGQNPCGISLFLALF
jgi:hypothetical protein